ncbi:hypothetical protein L1887_15931 [Cichorium endivia]|nr:hypothetical protein L1887_15931 [Cichorium endivia]
MNTVIILRESEAFDDPLQKSVVEGSEKEDMLEVSPAREDECEVPGGVSEISESLELTEEVLVVDDLGGVEKIEDSSYEDSKPHKGFIHPRGLVSSKQFGIYQITGGLVSIQKHVCGINDRHYCCSNHDHWWFKKPIGGKIAEAALSDAQEGGVDGGERAAAPMDPPAMALNRSKGERWQLRTTVNGFGDRGFTR